jgi:teichuronic acid biosynthesis glycosyltransferase TuaC
VRTQTLVKPALSGGRASAADRIPEAPDVAIRVLAVIPGDGQGNSFIFARRQVRLLRQMGIQIPEFYLGLRTSPLHLLRARRKIQKEIAQFKPDVIHAHYGTVTALVCSLVHGVPLVITFRGSDLNPHPSVSRLRGWVSTFLSQVSVLRAKLVICVSNSLRDQLWWGHKKAVVIPSGVNLDLFRPTDQGTARRIVGWSLEEKIVLFCGGREPQAKGLDLARAAVRLAEEWSGPIRFFNLDGNIDPEAVPVHLNAADCLVFTSLREGSPNIIKEALACNLPIVSVAVGDVLERLRGVSYSQVVGRSASEIATALRNVLGEKIRSNGRERVLDCSEENVADKLRKLYERVSNGVNSPGANI